MAKKTADKTATSTTAKKTAQPADKNVAETVKKADAISTGRRGLWTALIWLGVIVAILGLSWLSHREPVVDTAGAQAASDKIIDDFQAGDCETVYQVTTEEFRSRSTEQNWNTQCTTASDVLQGEAEAVETVDNNPDDEAVQFVYRIEGTDEQSYLFTTVMVDREGQWLMDGLSSQVEQAPAEIPAE